MASTKEDDKKERKKKMLKKQRPRHEEDSSPPHHRQKKKKPKLQHHEAEEEKEEENREQDGNPSSDQNTRWGKKKKKNAIVTDPRFALIHSDPRFQRMPRKESKVVIDDRFTRMLSDKRFADSSAPVDKRGKPRKKEENPLLHYYLHQDEEKSKSKSKAKAKAKAKEEEEEEEEEEDSDGLEMEVSLEEEEAMDEISSTGEDDDEDDDQDSVNSDICHYLMARHEDTPIAEQETHRLAVVNLDWDHIKAVDIYIVMSSCLPKGGQILSVAIYPTEFGLKCMKVEAERGPSDLIDKNEDDSEDEGEIDDEKLRSYELNKLRYYYAVVVFDSSATANHIYGNLDGIEFLRTSNVLDLRFIPDSMEFSQPPRDITTEAPTNYKQPDFETRALQHSKVNLTWEEDEPHRTKVLRQKFNSDQLDELNEYLATSESDDGDEEGHGSENEVAPLSNGEDKKNMDREKLRALLLSENASGSDEDEDKDMEITFNTGLEDLSKRILEKKEKKSETVWEQVLRKRSEKKKARRNSSKNSSEDDSSDYDDQEALDQPDDFFMEEEPSDSDLEVGRYNNNDLEGIRAKKNGKGTKKSPDTDKEQEATRAELELLFADDQEGKDHGQKGYNMKLKKVKGKKGKEVAAEMKLPDVDPFKDPRFSARLTSHLFALDPTDPQYKRSTTYARQQMGKRRTSRETEPKEKETRKSPEHGEMLSDDLVPPEKEKYELTSTVRSLKRNLQSLKKDPKAKGR